MHIAFVRVRCKTSPAAKEVSNRRVQIFSGFTLKGLVFILAGLSEFLKGKLGETLMVNGAY